MEIKEWENHPEIFLTEVLYLKFDFLIAKFSKLILYYIFKIFKHLNFVYFFKYFELRFNKIFALKRLLKYFNYD